ncbi:MAG: hypothetical protein GY820_36730, partial [Gammaproteobacteria bacterium]|nr:hypothetical protein [Gammaproteobacteria bacterium]
DELVYKVGVSAEYRLTSGTEITANYDFSGREDYTDQYVSASFRFMF